MDDFASALDRIRRAYAQFLMVGQRWDVEIEEPWDFASSNWQAQLRAVVRELGRQRPPEWIDYFAFRRGLYREVPPFAIGRLGWDNWLLWKALSAGSAVVDASSRVVAVHQNHLYYHPEGFAGICQSEEAGRNRYLAGDGLNGRTIADAPYELSPRGVRLSLRRKLRSFLKRTWLPMLNVSRPVRHALGLRHDNLKPTLDRLGLARRRDSQ